MSNTIPMICYPLDIRRMISLQLQLLASQCRLSEVIITETFDVLLSNKLFISKMISQNVMNSQINILIDEAKQAVISKHFFTQVLSLLR